MSCFLSFLFILFFSNEKLIFFSYWPKILWKSTKKEEEKVERKKKSFFDSNFPVFSSAACGANEFSKKLFLYVCLFFFRMVTDFDSLLFLSRANRTQNINQFKLKNTLCRRNKCRNFHLTK